MTSRKLSGNETLNPINGATKKAAEILTDNPDKALSQLLSKNIFTKFSIIPSIHYANY